MATATAGYTLIDDFLPEILQYVHGAPSILVRTHVRNAVVDFCQRTGILKRDPSTFQIEGEEHTYLMQFCQDRYIAIGCEDVFEEGVSVGNEREFLRTTSHQLDSEYHNWRNMTGNPTRYYLTEEINKIRFFPTPVNDGTRDIIVRGVVRPRRDQNEFDEFLYEKWHEVIQNGALASLLVIPAGSWFNAGLAAAMGVAYKRGVRQARRVALAGTGKFQTGVTPQSYDVMGSNQSRRTGTWV